MDNFDDLYSMLSMDRDDVRELKKQFESEVAVLLGNVRTHAIGNLNIQAEYDLNSSFDKYKMDDISIKHKMNVDAIEYKIALLQGYLQELFVEKKFLNFRRRKEEELTKEEYLEYVSNDNLRADKVASWYQEFIQK